MTKSFKLAAGEIQLRTFHEVREIHGTDTVEAVTIFDNRTDEDLAVDCDVVISCLGFKPDLREYGLGAQILVDLGLRSIRLLTNNPKKVVGLEGFNLEIVEQIPIRAEPTPHNARYLETKKLKLGHAL